MYQIKCDEYTLYDSRSEKLKLTEPVCNLKLNKTGSLSFKIAPSHPYYDKIYKLKSEISLYQDGEWIFTGRVLNDEVDFRNFKVIEVEGELGYLLDSIQRKKIYHITGDDKVKDYLTDVLAIHNEQVDDVKKFSVGNVTVTDPSDQLYKISSYGDTLSTLNEDLINTFKGYLIPRNAGNKKYLDYLTANDFETNTQIIEFGKNLIDLKKYLKGEDIATAIIPLGEVIDSEETDEGDVVDSRLDISSLGEIVDGTIRHDAGKDYIYDTEAVAKYGLIYKVLKWDGVTEADNLLTKAKEQLNYYKLQEFKLELSAFDLHLLDVNIEAIRLGQKIKVISKPHSLNDTLITTELSINISNPDKSSIILESEERTAKDINSISKKANDSNTNINKVEETIKDSGFVTDKEFENKLDEYLPEYLDSQQGTGSYMDLSIYATINDVNTAFDSLAFLLEDV